MEYISIDDASENIAGKIKQRLKHKTGKFVWRIKFSAALDPSSINANNLYVTTMDGTNVPASIHYFPDTKEIEIEPSEAYARDSSYHLIVTKSVRSAGGQALKKDVVLKFTV